MKFNLKSLSSLASMVGKLFLVTAILMLPFALAAEPPSEGQAIMGLIDAIKLGTVGAILVAVGQLLKTPLISSLIGRNMNSKYIPWVTTFIGVLISVGASWGSKVWYVSVIEGVLAGLISNGVFDHSKAVTQQS